MLKSKETRAILCPHCEVKKDVVITHHSVVSTRSGNFRCIAFGKCPECDRFLKLEIHNQDTQEATYES